MFSTKLKSFYIFISKNIAKISKDSDARTPPLKVVIELVEMGKGDVKMNYKSAQARETHALPL